MVLLTMPITVVISSPTSDSRSGRMMGMAPATAASKYRSTPARSAAAYSSWPCAASSALFAVTTEAPEANAACSRLLAGSIPPITSTTTSTPDRTSASLSPVNSAGSMPARSASG